MSNLQLIHKRVQTFSESVAHRLEASIGDWLKRIEGGLDNGTIAIDSVKLALTGKRDDFCAQVVYSVFKAGNPQSPSKTAAPGHWRTRVRVFSGVVAHKLDEPVNEWFANADERIANGTLVIETVDFAVSGNRETFGSLVHYRVFIPAQA